MPYFSFIMVCYNNWNYTKQALETFFESLNPIHQSRGVELIIIDNASTDETSKEIELNKGKYHELADITIIRLEQNLGYIAGVNIGISKCRGSIICILNNDLIFCPHWFDGIAEMLENNPEIGVAAPFLTNGSGAENVELQFDSPELKDSVFRSKADMNYLAQEIMKQNHENIIYSDRIIGACTAVKKEVLELTGGIDFWFGIGIFDDDDFTLRANIAGFKSVIVGKSFVYHVGNVSFAKERSLSNAAVLSNKMKFIHKWQLRCTENIRGLYNSRGEVISNIPYSRTKHFAPFSLEHFSSYLKKADRKDGEGKKSILLIADWTNFRSCWLKRLKEIASEIGDKYVISLWMPEPYFTKSEAETCLNKIKEYFSPEFTLNYLTIKITQEEIPAEELLRYMTSFNSVLSVEDDFVNRYIIYLAKLIGMQVL